MKRPAVAIAVAVLAIVAMAVQSEASIGPVPTPILSAPNVGYPNGNVTYGRFTDASVFFLVDWCPTYLPPTGPVHQGSGGAAGGIDVSVDILATVGHDYLITFAMEKVRAEDFPNEPLNATVVGQNPDNPAQPFGPDPTDGIEWLTESCYSFHAVSAHTTLTFFCAKPTGCSQSCYSVSAASVPEPATVIIWSLLGAASWLGMRVVRRGRRPGRQPWSNENRAAILEIIAKR